MRQAAWMQVQADGRAPATTWNRATVNPYYREGGRGLLTAASTPSTSLRRRPHPLPQHLGHAPRLGDAAARRKGRLGAKKPAEVADARRPQVRLEAFQEAAGAGPVVGVHPQPGVHKGADQP